MHGLPIVSIDFKRKSNWLKSQDTEISGRDVFSSVRELVTSRTGARIQLYVVGRVSPTF